RDAPEEDDGGRGYPLRRDDGPGRRVPGRVPPAPAARAAPRPNGVSNVRLRRTFAGETMSPPCAPFFLKARGTSRFLRGGTHGSPAGPLLRRKAFGFPAP